MARILIADDRPVNRELLVTLLRHAGHATIEASDGAEALDRALRERPDLAILDVAMPRLDGLSVARSLREVPETSATPILFYTAAYDLPDLRAWVASERASILTKPSEPAEILAVTSSLLGIAQAPAPVADPLTFRLSAIVEMNLELAAIPAPRAVVETALTRLLPVLDADAAGVVLHRETVPRVVSLSKDGSIEWRSAGFDFGELDEAIDRPPAIHAKPHLRARLGVGMALQSLIAVPLESAHARLGLLWIGRRERDFTPTDERLAAAIAAEVALAFENAQLHEALAREARVSTTVLSAVLDTVPVAVIVAGSDTVVQTWNKAAEQMFGWTAPEVVGRPLPLVPPELLAEVQAWRDITQSGGNPFPARTRRLRKNGTSVDVLVNAALLDGDAERAFVVAYADLTPLQRAEEDLARRASELEMLSARLIDAQEEERLRIAREIHDELGQMLTATKLAVTSKPLSIEHAVELLDGTIATVRAIARGLRPPVLDEFGLTAAIENEVAGFQERLGIECNLSIQPERIELDRDRSLALFRVLQEAMTNVARHAEATRLEVRIRATPAEVLLDIRDDGKGIPPEAVHDPHSIGLLGVRERIRAFGGTVAIEGVPGKGTIFVVRLPLKGAADADSRG